LITAFFGLLRKADALLVKTGKAFLLLRMNWLQVLKNEPSPAMISI